MSARIIAFFRYLVFRERDSYDVEEDLKTRIREHVLREAPEKDEEGENSH